LVRRRTSQLERRWYQRISRYQGSSSGTIDLVQCASTLPASAFDTAQHSDAYIYNYQNLSKNFTNTKTCSASGGSAQTSVIWGLLPNLTQGALALYPLWTSSLDPLTTSHRAFYSTKIVRIWRNITCQWLCHRKLIIATQFQLRSSSILYVRI